jgi:hypothetical protein
MPTAYGCEERRFPLAPEIPGVGEGTLAHP